MFPFVSIYNQQHKLNVALYKILHLNLHLFGLFKPVNVLNLLAHSDSILFQMSLIVTFYFKKIMFTVVSEKYLNRIL